MKTFYSSKICQFFILNAKENYKKFGLKSATGAISVKCLFIPLDCFALNRINSWLNTSLLYIL